MTLLPDYIRRQLPPIYAQEELGEDAVVHIHFFVAGGRGDWWITEGSPEDDDFIMFGLCDLGFPELGYVSLNELESVGVVERDLYWKPKTLGEVREGLPGGQRC